MANINPQNSGPPDLEKTSPAGSNTNDNLKQPDQMTYNFSSPNKRNAEEIVSPPRKEGRFAKAKYYMRAKEGADTNKQKAEETSPSPGRRRGGITKKKKGPPPMSLEEELANLGIDFNLTPGPEAWIPLELFDDKSEDIHTPSEWSERLEAQPLLAKGLYKNGKQIWKDVILYSYDIKNDKFLGEWSDDHSQARLSRIHIAFYEEDTRKVASRIANAFQQRIFADSILRYNYYIDNMPVKDLSEMTPEQQSQIEMLALNTRTLRDLKFDLRALRDEAGKNYARTMNKIIFDKYMGEHSKDLLPQRLELPDTGASTEEAPYFGLIQLPKSKESKEFTDAFKDFCLRSIFTKEESVRASQEIRNKCNRCQDLKLFYTEFLYPITIEDFKYQQESTYSQVVNYLQHGWVDEIVSIVRAEFSGSGKGWFNVTPNKETYDLGKLKKFLTMSKQMMQDVLLSMTRANYELFYNCIARYVPSKVTIQGPSEVTNEFENLKLTPSGKLETVAPLFYVDLVKPYLKDEFAYSSLPQNFVLAVTDVFDRTLMELGKIPDLEQKVVTDIDPLRISRFMKVPKKPLENPGEIPETDQYKFVIDENKWLWDIYNKLKELMERAVKPLEEYLNVYEPYKDILKINPDQYIRDLEQAQEQGGEQARSEEDIKKEIYEYKKKEEEVKNGIPDDVHISCFWVNCRELTGILAGRYGHMQKNLKGYISKRARERTQKLQDVFKEMEKKILEQPDNIEELTNLKEYLAQLPQEIEKVKVDITKCMDVYNILEEFQYSLSTDDLNKKWQVFGGPKEIAERIEARKLILEKEKARFNEEMVERQEEFKENIENLERRVLGFHQFYKIEEHEEVAKMAASINESLTAFANEAKTFNHHETLFGVEVTDYSKIQQLQKEFAPYSNLWLTSNQWFHNIKHWMNCQWEELDAEEGEKFMEEAVRTMGGVIRFFRDRGINQVLKIAEKVKAELDEFKPKVPLMVALRKKGMKERHWQQISEKVGFTVQPDEDFTFSKALEMGLMKNSEDIVEIGERASKEFAIEVLLNDMMVVWEKINFELFPFKQTWIIRGYDEINAILDEHIVQTQAMQFSPFKKPFEEKINNWNDQLLLMSTILEEWAKCQGQYMYLQPIFDSPDIAKQLPVESKKFKTVDSTWKFTLSTTKSIGNVLKVCSNEGPTEGLLAKIQEANSSLEVIQKELNNYLERKREAFARFYFLSNDELLEILSQTKEPTAVQPHLRKVFENIYKVEFDNDKIIHAMYSGEGEKVNFVRSIDPTKKNVEFWMGDLEEMMKVSVRDVLLNSVYDYAKSERAKWVISHSGQCVLNGSQVHWTSEVEQAIKQGKLNEYLEKSRKQISELVRLIRTKLSAMQSITINALIVIDVHAKDVVEKLAAANVDNIGAFEWISQLRYYWENDDCYVKCVQTNFPYGYEYLGNTLRLVITPLTDKCYMTLMGALKLNLGGAPAGPAGTGKTESTKDLAKALAKQCVVFNCSEGMDYTFVGKFFKGLASAGAWACFDEFNRINVEVLSVIAQQLLTLFGAKAREEKQVEFEGSNIKMNPTFSVFITMNPGYAGRTELPDNLKALFRPVAMMVPDYAMIGEIMLYSFGFDTARDLAGKMVATFKLSSEQLSSQDHYDYGMRAVRSVINAAGLLKRAEPDMDEQQLLLRALRDVNVPKFLKDDLPLFENIISDLFPDIERPQINYGDLLDGIKRACAKHNLQSTDSFVQKVLQLYDTIQVRHGLMIVGPTGGGKTSNYKVLQEAMSLLAKEKKKDFTKVETHILNPKSITMGQLYGWINESTKEWTDGILAYIVRETVKDTSGVKHWVMFDGPVDALWIESMNTVLDDNKKLCLNSGQILVLTPYMTMMFEVEDLAVASPATVSRCGMVYMEPVALGIQPLIDSWVERLPNNMKAKQTFIPALTQLFSNYVEQSIEFIKKNCRETVPTMVNALVQSLIKLFDCYLDAYRETEYKKVPVEEIENLESMLEPLFLFCLVWSVGCTVELSGRIRFDVFLKELMAKNAAKLPFPENGSVYDFKFNNKTKQYELWSESNKNFEIDQKLSYSEIAVPTNDYTRMLFLMKLLLTNDRHVMCPGPTGTGKSLNAYTLLQTGLSETYQYIALTFSAQTSANQTQDTIDSKMEKRRKGYFGPPTGKKCIIFVDDLNMPKKETYGAQPPIEILRQYLDHHGWYDVKKLEYRNLQDLILLTAMGPPGGGRTFITNRFARHFNMLTYTELDEHTIRTIFGVIVEFFLRKFPDSIKNVQKTLVDTVLHVYNTVKTELRPTPAKSFYTFNLRDISKVFQGICSASVKHCSEAVQMVRLWYHENLRVFHDRLTTEDDREFLKNLLKSQFDKFETKAEEVLDTERIIFGDFMQGRESEPKYYIQVREIKSLLERMEMYLDDYNSEGLGGSKKQMKLVMFLDACEHIARICRILRQPQGNALLLGVGGSGRQSLARMATFISNYKLFQIEVVKGYNMNKWRDDLKKCLMIAGVENKSITFLFVDTQIINEQMLEDINNILNTGDVSNLYKNEDYDTIYNACRAECAKKGIQPNKMNMFAVYLARVQRNIHCVIAMSPLGEVFRTRLRMFPSLINCATIDWFTEWPEEALIGVGKGALIDVAEELEITTISNKLVEMFKTVHKSVEKISAKYLVELRRHNYVTPTSYLEQLNLFKTILNEKRIDLKNQIDRLKNGLEKLKEANEAVMIMEIELKDMQPKLEQAEIDTTKMMERLVVDKQAADEAQILVAKDEAEASIQQQEALALQSEALEAVSSAQKMLDKTMEDVKSLEQKHLDEIKAFKSPPEAVFWTLAGVCVMLGEKVPLKPVPGSLTNEKKEDYFEYAKKELLSNPKEFLKRLLDFAYSDQKNNIPNDRIIKLNTKIRPEPAFAEEKVKSANLATKYLWGWVNAMYLYNETYVSTKPLRDKLAATEKILAEKTAELNIKKAELATITATIESLEQQYNETIREKERLTNRKQECEIKLERANKLTSGLSDEKLRWSIEVEGLEKKRDILAGDSLISAGMITYAGPFTSQFRNELESGWVQKLDEIGIKHTPNINMRAFLGDSVKIQNWNIAGLPKDDSSTENGIIIDKARRWPLMIDPQTQANKFIKNLGKEHEEGIEILKLSDPNLLRTIEISVQHGKWVLVENIGTELDPALEPILLQQTFKQGGSLAITIGDRTIGYSEHFKFFMTTTNPNPHYPPETFVKVTIINFAITRSGLEEQMLAQIVALEDPQLEQKKTEIVKKNAQDRKELLTLEDGILKSLSESQGDILMDETLINKLASSKKMSTEINQRVKDSKITEEQIDQKRESYRPVAYRASILFFCIMDLSNIDPMYQYSLQWFINLFAMGVENAPQSNEHAQRLANLNSYFTYSLYENVCRSLFEKHKLLFSLILTVRLLQGDNKMDEDEWFYLLSGFMGEVTVPPNPTKWIPDNSWPGMYRQFHGMDALPKLKGIEKHMLTKPDDFKEIYDVTEAHEQPLPEPWQSSLDEFEKMIVLKAIRPDKLIPAIQNWVILKIGKQFVEPPSFNLANCFKDSTVTTPLIFVLSPGSDPVADFQRFAEEMGFSKKYEQISLGQGQGPKAEKMIREYSQRGGWVLLQNCHLATSWMSELEKICEGLDENIHKDFRLWLTSMPTAAFPISVLQNGVKMTLEPPTGLRANLQRTYNTIDDKELNDCKKPEPFKKLLFGFALFHAILLERRKFGPIGWNIPYEFTNEDFAVCKKQLKLFLDDYDEIPFKVLNYIGAEINYGGRVTDDKDVRLIKTILENYIVPGALTDGYKYSESGLYQSIAPGDQADYLNYIKELPLNPAPEAFGLHDNAEISTAENSTRILLETILSTQPRSTAKSGKSAEEVLIDTATNLEKRTPPVFDFDEIYKKYPTEYNESMNTVLVQEIIRYNRLLAIMPSSLANLKKAVKGEIVMSEELELMARSLGENQVPEIWKAKSFLSLKPLSSWIEDLNQRITFLNNWIQNGTPNVFWISGLFFPQAFITGALQNYARKNVIAIDRLGVDFKILDDRTHHDIKEKPESGCYVYGMFIEGARWDSTTHALGTSRPKELYTELPLIWLVPVADRKQPETGIYNCPVYKVLSRAGTLSTTGHSTNFVMYIELPSQDPESTWIRAGVAGFLALRY